MVHLDKVTHDIASMPRGGPDASWLDRQLRTDRLEYLDRDDVDDLKRRVIQALDRGERMLGQHALLAGIALDEVTDVPNPKIFELSAGHGGPSRAARDAAAKARKPIVAGAASQMDCAGFER